jgi:hypothetical protein
LEEGLIFATAVIISGRKEPRELNRQASTKK